MAIRLPDVFNLLTGFFEQDIIKGDDAIGMKFRILKLLESIDSCEIEILVVPVDFIHP